VISSAIICEIAKNPWLVLVRTTYILLHNAFSFIFSSWTMLRQRWLILWGSSGALFIAAKQLNRLLNRKGGRQLSELVSAHLSSFRHQTECNMSYTQHVSSLTK
jgi:hypothetical protein